MEGRTSDDDASATPRPKSASPSSRRLPTESTLARCLMKPSRSPWAMKMGGLSAFWPGGQKSEARRPEAGALTGVDEKEQATGNRSAAAHAECAERRQLRGSASRPGVRNTKGLGSLRHDPRRPPSSSLYAAASSHMYELRAKAPASISGCRRASCSAMPPPMEKPPTT